MIPSVQLAAGSPDFSRLVAGVMTWGVWGHDLDTKGMQNLIEHCLATGITTFDHADIYGHYTTEAAFGAVLKEKPGLRTQMQLISKCGIRLVCSERPENKIKSYDVSRDYIIRSAEQSLKNLATDYLDLLLIHRPSPLMQAEEIAAAFAQLKEQGKVRAFGVSNFTAAQFSYLQQVTPLVTNQLEVSTLHSTAMFDGTLVQCQQLGIRPMAWSPLGGLFKRTDGAAERVKATLAEIASNYGDPGNDVLLLAWLLKHPAGILPVLGTARATRLSKAGQALSLNMTDADWFALLEAARGQEVA